MRDYVTSVTDTPALIAALYTAAANGSPYCYVDPNGEAKFIAAKTPIKNTGVKSVGVCRLTQAEHDWFITLPTCSVIGWAKDTTYLDEDEVEQTVQGKFIKSFECIEWVEGGLDIYYATYDQTPVTYTDTEGNEVSVTPPTIQGIIAS
jgi:hypothetical protein